jgi:CHAT domain-containing protein
MSLLAVAVIAATLARAEQSVAHGDYERATAIADEADRQPDVASRAAAAKIRGDVAAARDSLAASTEHYERAVQLAIESGDSDLIARAYDKLDSTYALQGRHDKSLDLADRLLARAPANDPNRAMILVLRGSAYSNMNDPESADRDFSAALALPGSSDKVLGIIHRFRGLWLWRFKRDFPGMMHEYDLALEYATRAKAWSLVVMTENAYGNPFRDPQHRNPGEALRHYETGLAIARREHLEARVPYFLKNIGDVYRQIGDEARAKPALEEAIAMGDRYRVQEVRWGARCGLAKLLSAHDPAAAERYFNEALDLLEAQQSGVLLDDFRPGVLADQLRFDDPYDGAIALLLAENRTADAFLVAERKRARIFLETLATARDPLRETLPPGFAAAEHEVLARIRTAQAMLRSAELNDAARAKLLASVERAESDLTQLQLRLALERPAVAHVRYPKLWSVKEIQSRLLAADEAMLAIHLGAARSVAWIITRDRIATITLPAQSAIERTARAAISDLRNPAVHDGANLVALSRALNAGAIAQMPQRRLVVVPDGVLHDVPFEALLDAHGQPLVERFAISYAPSASALAFLRSMHQQRAGGATTLIAVANPLIDRSGASSTRQMDLARMGLLGPLPKTADEARGIAKLFGASAIVFEGAHASRAELELPDVQDARILHFATHGLIDETRPLRSGLVLTANPPRDDGLLQMRDIYAMRVNADLVTLSACDTALGENVTGEGMIGLTRAFFFAGARSVAASLWSVEDTATSRFMQDFYANIHGGEPIDIALQHAKIDFIHRGGRDASPFFWAPFIVSGNARAVVDVPPQRLPAWTIAIVAAVALILLLGPHVTKRFHRPPS